MGIGYFLVRGNRTTCGGSIIEGCDNHSIHGQATARNGDKYICGVDKKIYHIAGGIPNYFIHGVAAAGTAHSRGTCACKCYFINSFTDLNLKLLKVLRVLPGPLHPYTHNHYQNHHQHQNPLHPL